MDFENAKIFQIRLTLRYKLSIFCVDLFSFDFIYRRICATAVAAYTTHCWIFMADGIEEPGGPMLPPPPNRIIALIEAKPLSFSFDYYLPSLQNSTFRRAWICSRTCSTSKIIMIFIELLALDRNSSRAPGHTVRFCPIRK